MTKSDLYEEVAFELGLPKKEARQTVDLVFKLITDALVAGDDVKIKDFCTMRVVEKAPRNYRDRAGELQTTDPGKRVRLRMSGSVMQRIDLGVTSDGDGTAEDDEELGNICD